MTNGCNPAVLSGALTAGAGSGCKECGQDLSGRLRRAEFCGKRCKQIWNTRRTKRGLLFHDLIMANRYERKLAYSKHVYSLITTLASTYRAEDHDRRGGRLSWVPLRDVLDANPHLFTKIYRTGGRRGRSR